uniref:Uncharacterized protein n=1 Tax=Cacopsylla melanoneura TaxID=428564 RepID=A0A8D9E9H1_9HEMI
MHTGWVYLSVYRGFRGAKDPHEAIRKLPEALMICSLTTGLVEIVLSHVRSPLASTALGSWVITLKTRHDDFLKSVLNSRWMKYMSQSASIAHWSERPAYL